MELLLLFAIAYAGARGVEAIAGTTDRRHKDRSKDADSTVAKVAASGPKGGDKAKKPGPTEPGGTFTKAAPRSAAAGGKAALPVAVVVETGSTMWKSVGEGYREAMPALREQHRQKMAERAQRRQAEKAAAAVKKKTEEAAAKAGPPPPYPPRPTEPPASPEPAGADGAKPDGDEDSGDRVHVITAVPEPRTAPDAERDLERERADAAEAKAEAARKEADTVRAQAATDKVLAAQKAEREAKEREAAAEERACEAEAKAADADRRRHLSVVPTSTEENGDLMSSPSTIIPEVRTLDGLLNAFTLLNAMFQMRAEEAEAIAADDLALSNRLDAIEAEMAELEVDDATRADVGDLRESIHTQSKAAGEYGTAALDAAGMATAAAGAAHKSHGGIAEAVQSSPIARAAQAGYYER